MIGWAPENEGGGILGSVRRASGGSTPDPFGYLGALDILPMHGPQIASGGNYFWSHPALGGGYYGPFPSEEILLDHFSAKAKEAGLYRRGGSVRSPHYNVGALRSFVADLRQHAADQDGTLDLRRYQHWRAARAGAMHHFPEVWELLDTPEKAQHRLAQGRSNETK